MNQSDSIGNLAAALAKAQGEMGLAEKSAQNPHLKNNYADLTSVWMACREALGNNGLAVSQLPTSHVNPDDGVTIIGLHCVLMHGDSGEWISTYMESPAVGNRGVNDLQAAGSVITYLRRYTLSAIVGVATGDDDDGSSVRNREERPAQKQTQQTPEQKDFNLGKWYQHIMDKAPHFQNKHNIDGALKLLRFVTPENRDQGLALVEPLVRYGKYRDMGKESDEAVDLVLNGQKPLFEE